MNNIYRVVWNRAKGGWEVASELAGADRCGKTLSQRGSCMRGGVLRHLPWALACAFGALALCVPVAHAGSAVQAQQQQLQKVDSRVADLSDLLVKYGNADANAARQVAPSVVSTRSVASRPHVSSMQRARSAPTAERATARTAAMARPVHAIAPQGRSASDAVRAVAAHVTASVARASRSADGQKILSPRLADSEQIAAVLARRHASGTQAVPGRVSGASSSATTWVVDRDGSLHVDTRKASSPAIAAPPTKAGTQGIVAGRLASVDAAASLRAAIASGATVPRRIDTLGAATSQATPELPMRQSAAFVASSVAQPSADARTSGLQIGTNLSSDTLTLASADVRPVVRTGVDTVDSQVRKSAQATGGSSPRAASAQTPQRYASISDPSTDAAGTIATAGAAQTTMAFRSASMAPIAATPMALPPNSPQRPPAVDPTAPPPGLIMGTGGLVGNVGGLLNPTVEDLLNPNQQYLHSGALKLAQVNITQTYQSLGIGSLGLVNLTPVGQLINGTLTGHDQNLTLLGGVTSGSYITNVNRGVDGVHPGTQGGLLGLLLPDGSPAWSDTCASLLGIPLAQCWAVNAAQNNQVIIGDHAAANGSEEVVIGTGASHTLPSVDANTVFPGDGNRDSSTDPMGVPDADYQSRMGHSVVIGDSASGTQNMQTILGANATSDKANSVALGYGSNAGRGALSGYTTAFGLTGKAQDSAGEVAVGNAGHERQITHVAAGTDAYDAVNVKQLEGAINGISTGNDKLAVKYDADANGDATNTVTLVGDGSGKTVSISNLSEGALGSTSTDAVNGSQLYATNSILATYLGGTTNYDGATNTWTAPDFKISNIALDGSVTTGDYNNVTEAFEHLNTSLLNVNKRIKNGGPGGGPSKYFKANSTGAEADASGTESVAMGGNTVAKGDNSIAAGNGAQAQSNDAIAIGHGASASGGQAVAIGPGAQATGDGAVSIGDPNVATGTGAVALGKDNTATGTGAVALGNTSSATADGAVAIGNGASSTVKGGVALGTGSVADRVDAVSVGSKGHERQVTNVAAGTANTDAVNVAQLKASEHGTVRYDTYNNGDTNYNSVTLGDPNGGGGTTVIHNVGPGTDGTDAVNVDQLNSVKNWAQQYTDQRVNEFNRALNSLGNHAYAGIASAMAMAGLPQAYLPGKNMASFAASSFRGESSIAIGVSMISDNGRWVYKLSGTDNSRGDAGVSIGAGIQW